MTDAVIYDRNENPLYSVGVNYWPRETGPLMWRKWDGNTIRHELQQIAELDLNTLRYFLYWPDFMPEPNVINEEMIERLQQFDGYCAEFGLHSFPSLFVGHMSGEDWDVPWRGARSFYSDPWMLEQETLYVRRITKLLKDSESVAGWLLSNEITNYAGDGPYPDVIAWARRMCDTIRTIDPDRPISIGEGAWAPEIYGERTEFRLRDLQEFIDFGGPHFYHKDTDELRHSVLPQFVTRGTRQFLQPSLIEEFGCSNAMASPDNQAAYFRNTLYGTLLSGSMGAWAWCYSDFDLPYQRPYSHHGHEFYFGITTSDREVKPSGKVLSEFSRSVNSLELAEYEINETGVSLLIPSFFYENYPYTWDDKNQLFGTYLQTFAMLTKGNLNPDLLYEPLSDFTAIEDKTLPDIPAGTKMLCLPFHRKLTAQYQIRLLEWIEDGGVFYASFGQMPWLHYFSEFFGSEHQLRFGLTEYPRDASVEFTAQRDFGEITSGESISFTVAGEYQKAGFCPVIPDTAEVIMTDQWGNPALLSNSIGDGAVYFCTYPVEYYASVKPNINQTDVFYRIFKSIGMEKGVGNSITVDSSFVQAGLFTAPEKPPILICLNHGWDEIHTQITLPETEKPTAVKAIRSEKSVVLNNKGFNWSFPAKGAEIFLIETSTA